MILAIFLFLAFFDTWCCTHRTDSIAQHVHIICPLAPKLRARRKETDNMYMLCDAKMHQPQKCIKCIRMAVNTARFNCPRGRVVSVLDSESSDRGSIPSLCMFAADAFLRCDAPQFILSNVVHICKRLKLHQHSHFVSLGGWMGLGFDLG